MLVGIHSSVAVYGCPFGECIKIKDGKETGKYEEGAEWEKRRDRTEENCLENHDAWVAGNTKPKELKYKYKACENPPVKIFLPKYAKTKFILRYGAAPLHLVIGNGNFTMDNL